MDKVDKDKLICGKAYKIYFSDCCIDGQLLIPAIFRGYRIPKDYAGDDAPEEFYTSFPEKRGYELYNYDLIFDIGEFNTHDAITCELFEVLDADANAG